MKHIQKRAKVPVLYENDVYYFSRLYATIMSEFEINKRGL